VRRWYRAVLDPADDFFPLECRHLWRFDRAEWRRRVASTARALRQVVLRVWSRPDRRGLWQELDRFHDSLPAGMCSLEVCEDRLEGFFARRGVPNRFGEMPRRLAVVAYDLDAGRRVAFGLGDQAHVPVAKAICASIATPGLFAPVRIGERDYVAGDVGGVGHLDLLAGAGATLVVVVNPMVPVRNDPGTRRVPTGHGPMPRVRDKGLVGVYDQARRIGAHAGLEREAQGWRSVEAPGTELVRLEPHPDDAALFWQTPMDLDARRALLRCGYDRTTRRLRREARRVLALLQEGLGA
jgi:predicted acylesterase/phospholipase RssA